MKKIVLCVVAIAAVLSACDRDVNIYDERPTVTVEGDDPSPAYVGSIGMVQCGTAVNDTADDMEMDLDCAGLGIGWYCASNKEAAGDLGVPINTCVPGCYARFSTDQYTGDDSKVYDSCAIVDEGFACSVPQFGGDGKCHKVKEGTATTTPTEPGTTTPTGKSIAACYALSTAEVSTYFGQFSWPAPNTANPNAWGTDEDKTIGSNGCFSGNLTIYASNGELVVDMTVGPQKGKKASEVTWVGKSKKPTKVTVDGKEATLSTTVFNSAEPTGFDPTRGWVFKY